MESLEKVWNLFFQFPDLGKSMEICEKLWKFQKKVWNFLPFTWEKNFEDRKCASIPLKHSKAAVASLTESNSSVPSFHVCTYLSYKLRMAGPELFARRLNNNNKKASSEQFVCREKFVRKPGHGSWLRLRVFVNEESTPEPSVFCRLAIWLCRLRRVTQAKIWLLFARWNFCLLNAFVGWSVSLSLPLKDTTSSRFRCSSFLFFLSLWRERRRGSRSMPVSRFWFDALRTCVDPPRSQIDERCIAVHVRRSLSDHVQSTSGQPKPYRRSLARTSRKRCGEARVPDLWRIAVDRDAVTARLVAVDCKKDFFLPALSILGFSATASWSSFWKCGTVSREAFLTLSEHFVSSNDCSDLCRRKRKAWEFDLEMCLFFF